MHFSLLDNFGIFILFIPSRRNSSTPTRKLRTATKKAGWHTYTIDDDDDAGR